MFMETSADITSVTPPKLTLQVRMSGREARLRREDRKSVYRIHGWGDTVLNIPPAAATLANYSATLGHKANHAKKPNSEFRFLQHPR
jgi:hypothetical protein